MKKNLTNIPPKVKYSALIITGLILLLHSIGFFTRGLTTILVIISIAMIIYGLVGLGFWNQLQTVIKNKKLDQHNNQQ